MENQRFRRPSFHRAILHVKSGEYGCLVMPPQAPHQVTAQCPQPCVEARKTAVRRHLSRGQVQAEICDNKLEVRARGAIPEGW